MKGIVFIVALLQVCQLGLASNLRDQVIGQLEMNVEKNTDPTKMCRLKQTSDTANSCPSGMYGVCSGSVGSPGCLSKKDYPDYKNAKMCSIYCDDSKATTYAEVKCEGYFYVDASDTRYKIQDQPLCYPKDDYEIIGRSGGLESSNFCLPWSYENNVYRNCPSGKFKYCQSDTRAPICIPNSAKNMPIDCTTYHCNKPDYATMPECSGYVLVNGDKFPLKYMVRC